MHVLHHHEEYLLENQGELTDDVAPYLARKWRRTKQGRRKQGEIVDSAWRGLCNDTCSCLLARVMVTLYPMGVHVEPNFT